MLQQTPQPAAGVRVPLLPETGYRGMPTLRVNQALAPVTFVWWASSPSGRQSKYLQTWSAERLRRCGSVDHSGIRTSLYVPTPLYATPLDEIFARLRSRGSIQFCRHLPQGYRWQGPALVNDVQPPSAEGPWHDGLFLKQEPEHVLAPLVPAPASLADARQLATRILRDASLH